MAQGVWGKKIGMTQVYAGQDAVIPVTVIDIGRWVVVGSKTQERDGYQALVCGLVKQKFADQQFDPAWVKKPKQYFEFFREVAASEASPEYAIGAPVDVAAILVEGERVNVTGHSKGRGFAGVVKRHGYAGGSASHGPRFGRWPGALSYMRSQGRVPKGKALPGHFGTTKHTIQKLRVVSLQPEENVILIKGAVPGGPGSLVYVQKV